MVIKNPLVVTNRKTLAKVLEQDTFVLMPKVRYDELVAQIEYLEQVIEALRAKFQDARSIAEIVDQHEDELDRQLAASPAFQKRIAEARANYAVGKGGDWDDIVRQRKRKQK